MMPCLEVESKLADKSTLPFELMIKSYKEGRSVPPPSPLSTIVSQFYWRYILTGVVCREKKGWFVLELNRLFLWLITLLDNKPAKSPKSFLL